MIIKVEQFCKLMSKGKVFVKIPLKKFEYSMFGLIDCYTGKEKYVWCSVSPLHSFDKEGSYKVYAKSIDENYNGREWYTEDLISFINEGRAEMKTSL